MGKSLKNVVTPDEMCEAYCSDTFRVYEMSMGPLEVSRPWDTRAVVGSYRFLERVWRTSLTRRPAPCRVSRLRLDNAPGGCCTASIDGVRVDIEGLRFNTAIAKLIELTNRSPGRRRVDSARGGRAAGRDGVAVRPAPGRGAVGRLGHDTSIAYVGFPVADPALLVAESVTYPVQVNGKVRGRIEVPADAAEDAVRGRRWPTLSQPGGADPRKVIVVPGGWSAWWSDPRALAA